MSDKIDNKVPQPALQTRVTAPAGTAPFGQPGEMDALAQRFESLLREADGALPDTMPKQRPLAPSPLAPNPEAALLESGRAGPLNVQQQLSPRQALDAAESPGAAQTSPGEDIAELVGGEGLRAGLASVDPRTLGARKLQLMQQQHEVKLQVQEQAVGTAAQEQAAAPSMQQLQSWEQAAIGNAQPAQHVDGIACIGEVSIARDLQDAKALQDAQTLQDVQTMQADDALSQKTAQEEIARDPSVASSPAHHELRRHQSEQQDVVAQQAIAAQVVQAQTIQWQNTPKSLPQQLLESI